MLLAQRGQALPLGIALLLVGSLAALVLFNTGQVAIDKTRVANTADSAAYSGMLWQARAMNFQAYTNRAMVANQVSMAQAVSLHSWIRYGAVASGNARDWLSWVPVVNGFLEAFANVVEAIRMFMQPILDAMVSVIDPINHAIGVAQEAMFVSSFVATPDIVRSVVKASDPRFETDTAYALAGLAQNLTGWRDFTESYERDDEAGMAERADVIMESRDPFTRERNWDFFEGFWFYSTPFTKHNLLRRGETRLTMHTGGGGEPNWEWMAKDTISWHDKIWSWKGTKNNELAIGWASSYANDKGGDSLEQKRCRSNSGQDQGHCRYADRNRKAEREADSNAESLSGYNGVNAYRSLSAEMREQEDHDPVLRLRTEVAMPLEDTYTSEDTVVGEEFATDVDGPGGVMSSISVAEVHYRRPDARDEDGKVDARARQVANGYNPYWEARLAPVSLTERLVATGLRGTTGGGGGGNRAPAAGGDGPLASYAGDDGTSPTDGTVGGGGVGGDGDGGNAGGGTLGTYAGSLAGAYGVDEGAVAGAIVDRGGVSLATIEGLEMGDPLELVGDLLEEKMKDAIKDILQGAMNAAVGAATSYIDANIVDTDLVQQGLEARDRVREIRDEYERIRVEVAGEFQAYFDDAMVAYESTVGALRDEIAAQRAEIDAVIGAVPQAMADALARLEEEREAVYDELVDTMTGELTDIIRSHANVYWDEAMGGDVNREIVKSLLDQYFDPESGEEIEVEERFAWDE